MIVFNYLISLYRKKKSRENFYNTKWCERSMTVIETLSNGCKGFEWS